MGGRPVVLLGIANEIMGVSFVKFYFVNGLEMEYSSSPAYSPKMLHSIYYSSSAAATSLPYPFFYFAEIKTYLEP